MCQRHSFEPGAEGGDVRDWVCDVRAMPTACIWDKGPPQGSELGRAGAESHREGKRRGRKHAREGRRRGRECHR